jgi:hypothetical protein
MRIFSRTIRISLSRTASFLAAGFLLCAPLCAADEGADQNLDAANLPSMAADRSLGVLDTGFRDLYRLDFSGARAEFLSYQRMQPEDPLGKAAEAASYLYEEFNVKGVFTSAFFLNDSKLLGGVDGSASENRNDEFLGANHQAREMAKRRVDADPRDVQGLLVLTLADGMESDYDALIVKKQVAALGLMRKAEDEAVRLLAIDSSAQDAYVALGASNYIIGCMPGYKRLFLRFGGIHGDRARGMQQMQIAAEHGRYLQPFAKILLALAFEREHQMERARALLAELTHEFPENPLFAHELALTQLHSPIRN